MVAVLAIWNALSASRRDTRVWTVQTEVQGRHEDPLVEEEEEEEGVGDETWK